MRFEGSADLSPHEMNFVNEVTRIFMASGASVHPMSLTLDPEDPPKRVYLPPRQVNKPAPNTIPTPPAPAPAVATDLANLRGTQTLPCANCGKTVKQSSWQVKRNNGKVYCCRDCFWLHRLALKSAH